MSKDWNGNANSIYKTLGASNHTDKEREEHDFYATSSIAVDKLYATGELTCKNIWECACGEGDLSKRLEDFKYTVRSTDLIDRGYGESDVDFLAQGHKVFMFLKLTFLEGKKRFDELFSKYPPKKIYVFSQRVLCAKNGDFEGMKAGGGSAVAYAWYVWEKGYTGDTIIKWI